MSCCSSLSEDSNVTDFFPSGNKRYDVFLSFRGPDTRESFVKDLYSKLDREGVVTFFDEKCLPKGKYIPHSLLKGVGESRIGIPIFSRNFAQSQWFLTELLHMVKWNVKIYPVFYDILPNELGNPDGDRFVQDFNKHCKKKTAEAIAEWKSAIKTVSGLSGWCFDQSKGHEELINNIVADVLKNLHHVNLHVPQCFGIEGPVNHVNSLLKVGDHKRKMIKVGIHGIGGIGKTTLAKFVCKQICFQFAAVSFVLNVREKSVQEVNGLAKLQEQMLRDLLHDSYVVDDVDQGMCFIEKRLKHKKVLLLLDDVETPGQLEALGGKFCDFGEGSRLLITSRNQQILRVANVDEEYGVRKLQHEHAHELFTFHAFPNSSCSSENLETECNGIVNACDGYPLALQVLGNNLAGERDRYVWKDMVDKVRHEPTIEGKLKTCYDSLACDEKEVFQDIACYLSFTEKEKAIIFWEVLKPSPNPHASLRNLFQKSFVSFGPRNELLMHSCLQDLGRSLARDMSLKPRKRTRLFIKDDVRQLFSQPQGKAYRVLYLLYEPKKQKTLNGQMFNSLSKLLLLWLANVGIEGKFSEAQFQDLRWLRWRRCASKSLPSTMNLKRLAILEVTDSDITHLWDERSEENPNILPRKIKALNVSGCVSLIRLPGLLVYTHLQILDLKNCKSLRSLPKSMGNFKSLVSLNMEGCGVSILPDDFGDLSSLRKLNLSRCEHLCKLPSSFGNLTELERLDIHHNPKLTELPETFGDLKALLYLDAGYCQLSDDGLPFGISELYSLKIMHLEHNRFGRLPSGLKNLSNLWELHLDGCKKLSTLPDLPPQLEMLYVRDCKSLNSLCGLSDLKMLTRLDVRKSHHLTELPGLQSLQSLTTLNLLGCQNISTDTLKTCLGGLKSLESLFIGGPTVSPLQLQKYYDSITAVSFDEGCLVPGSKIETPHSWRVVEAGGKKGEIKVCVDEKIDDKATYCVGYVVCSLAQCEAFPKKGYHEAAVKDVEIGYNCTSLDPTNRLWCAIKREEGQSRPCQVRHSKLNVNGGDGDVLEVRVVRAEDDSGFEWLRTGTKLSVEASSDYENWRASFKFLFYDPPSPVSSTCLPSACPFNITFGL